MSDIFQEVDEEVRRDKAAEFWKKHQYLIIGAAALIVLATAGYRFYENRRLAAEQAAGAAFQQALALDRAGKGAEADAAMAKLAADAPRGYRTLARLAEAAILAKSDPRSAIAAYDALAADASIGASFQQPPACAPPCCAWTQGRPARPRPRSRSWREAAASIATPRAWPWASSRWTLGIMRPPANGSTSWPPTRKRPKRKNAAPRACSGSWPPIARRPSERRGPSAFGRGRPPLRRP